MSTTTPRRALAAALLTLAAAASFVLAATPPAPAAPRLALPAPTGAAPVGVVRLHLEDRSRPDPWVPGSGPRQVGVTLFHPARSAGRTPAQYLTPAESAAFVDFQREQAPELASVPREILSTVDTHATTDAPPRAGKRPLVLLSPGFSLPVATLTGLATDLASRGCLVAALDHPYESSGTTLADGTLAACAACDETASLQTSPRRFRNARDRVGVRSPYARVARVRARDTAFVLDTLLTTTPWRDRIDPRRIGMAGHSIGGNAAAVADRRVRAAVDLDGTLFEPVARHRRPLLLLGTQSLHRPGGEDESWDRTWDAGRGPGAWLTVARSNHGSFTDIPAFGDQLGLSSDTPPGKRLVRITRDTVAAFLDRHLRGRHAPLPRFPEVRVERRRAG